MSDSTQRKTSSCDVRLSRAVPHRPFTIDLAAIRDRAIRNEL